MNLDTTFVVLYGKDFPASTIPENTKVEEGKMFKGKKEGVWKVYFSDGKTLKIQGEYTQNKPNGKYTKYYQNGKIKEKGTFTNQHYTDTLVRYFQDGTLECQLIYNEAGELTGTARYYHENGNLALTSKNDENKPIGKTTWYEEDGNIRHQLQYKKNGKVTLLFENENSTAIRIKNNVNGVLSPRVAGPITKDNQFDPNGYNIIYTKHDEIFQIGWFTNGALVEGKTYSYDENGILKKIHVYHNGAYVSEGQINEITAVFNYNLVNLNNTHRRIKANYLIENK